MNQSIAQVIYRTAAALRGEATFTIIKKCSASQYWNDDQWNRFHQERIESLLLHLKTNIPFYKDLEFSSLSDLPIIEKQQVQSEGGRFRSSTDTAELTKKTTGGSMGVPVTIYKDSTAMAHEQGATLRSYQWAGIYPGMRQGRFWGTAIVSKNRAKDRLKDLLLNRRRISAFNLTEAGLKDFITELGRFKVQYLYGYASIVREFARVVHESGRRTELSDLKAIITTSELLTPEIRCDIESWLGTKVFNEYGCGEVGTIAHECEHGSLHINSENLIVEVIDDAGNPVFGSDGHLVLTELHNRAQPLVRYKVGDFGRMSGVRCPCGRTLPVLDEVYGRAGDIVFGPNDSRYHPMFFFYIFEKLKKERDAFYQFQVTQDDRLLIVKAVKGLDYRDGDLTIIESALKSEFGDYFTINTEIVDAIPREASGKMRVVKRLS